MQTNIHEAKSQLSQWVERQLGQFKGPFIITDDFDSEQTNEAIANLFMGSNSSINTC
jgi:hypothetical protein